MKNIKLLGAVIISLYFTTSALASDDQRLSQALENCTKQKDNLVRLGCFDQLAENLTLTENLIITPSNELHRHQVDKKEIPPMVSDPSKKVASFAKNHLKKIAGNKAEISNEITATIIQAKKMLRGQWQVSLNNGQKWQQKDTVYLKLTSGDEVILEEGALGAFYLKKLTSNRRIRVRRIL